MKYICITLLILVSTIANAGICKNENAFSPYEANGIEKAVLLYGFRKNLPDYRFAVRVEEEVQFVPNFSEDRRALIDGNFYQFVEQDISSLKLKGNLTEKEILQEYKKKIVKDIRQEGAKVNEQPICETPNNPSKRNFASWKLDISASASKPAVTQIYSATVLNGQIMLINTGTPYLSDTSKIEKTILYYIATFQEINSVKDCPRL